MYERGVLIPIVSSSLAQLLDMSQTSDFRPETLQGP